MKHSILLKVGDNLIYQCATEVRPMQTNADGMKDFIFWQSTLKSYLIKPEYHYQFDDFINADSLSAGISIPHELMELTEDKITNKKYAKKNEKMNYDSASNKILSIGFTCKLCNSIEDITVENYNQNFEICKQCIDILKKVIKNNQ